MENLQLEELLKRGLGSNYRDREVGESFSFMRSWWEALQLYPDREQLIILRTIFAYAFGGEIVVENPMQLSTIINIKPIIDKSIKNRRAGKKGGEKILKTDESKDSNPKLDPFAVVEDEPFETESW